MGYKSLLECVSDLQQHGHLVRIDDPVDPHLEAAAIHRRVFAAGGPAILFANVRGCQFPMVSNLFGTIERARFMFRDSLETVQRLIDLKLRPADAARRPWRYLPAVAAARRMMPKFVHDGPILANTTTIGALPQLQSWPHDGGAFVTLPQVYSEDIREPGWRHSNLGMYRIQLSGSEYAPDREIGLHYQTHRGIGIHHAAAVAAGVPFRVVVFVGGPPAMHLAAVMPLPEGMSELTFAGALGGRRVRMVSRPHGLPIHADTDFCIVGTVDPQRLLPEGPFGDHLGYYSLRHDFPVLQVEAVYHRDAAVWPFTVVGRPPQEDTIFGQLIHELTGPIIPQVLPGVEAVHAVDASGVHPLLFAIGSERYTPFQPAGRPAELLTQANAILGQGQLSLAKYLFITSKYGNEALDVEDISGFLRHVLSRVDWSHDLHFQTRTTIDTLDYSGEGLNSGSKLVVAAHGPVRRELPTNLPSSLRLPDGFRAPRMILPGVLAVAGPACEPPTLDDRPANITRDTGNESQSSADMLRFCSEAHSMGSLQQICLVVVVDDTQFVAESLGNFLWVTFTRSNPAADIYGIDSFTTQKHWGCRGALVIDARIKPHHAPVLEEDPQVIRRVEQLAGQGGPLAGIL